MCISGSVNPDLLPLRTRPANRHCDKNWRPHLESRHLTAMFEITKDQLRQLGDVHLRELVARLCEAELRNAGLPVSAVRWGGAHTAPDGGLDIDCRVEAENFRGDFVPRRFTGFQVKKSSMPPARIVDEMSPHGALRPIFYDLAAANGWVRVSYGIDSRGFVH